MASCKKAVEIDRLYYILSWESRRKAHNGLIKIENGISASKKKIVVSINQTNQSEVPIVNSIAPPITRNNME